VTDVRFNRGDFHGVAKSLSDEMYGIYALRAMTANIAIGERMHECIHKAVKQFAGL
jgi:hypothetical protein